MHGPTHYQLETLKGTRNLTDRDLNEKIILKHFKNRAGACGLYSFD
jgi:hypothetical protein